ncbi:MAG: hypothetical protein MK066_04530 [Crocinitomicaceae bacterium]|nr:hypothetical protein [Crocinitomicaceae bacterium]
MVKFDKSVRYAVKMFLGIGGFFMILYLLGLGHRSEFRILNLFIVIFFTAKLAEVNLIDDENIGYLRNLGSVFKANVICVLLSVLGLAGFVAFFDPDFISSISSGVLFANTDTLSEVLLTLALEGISTAAVISFGVMQYWKNYKRTRKTLF